MAGYERGELWAAALGVWLLGLPARAETNALPDYGPALAMFQSFGLDPADGDGQYATISLEGQNARALQPIAEIYSLPFSGKGWIWPASNGLPARYLFLGGLGGACRLQDEDSAATASGDAEALPIAIGLPADLEEDLANLREVLRGQTAAEDAASDEFDGFDSGQPFAASEPAGALLLAAAHLHQAGRTNVANEIAERLFQWAPDRAVVVRGAVAQLAEIRYAAAGNRLVATRDWRAYRGDLQAVLDRFGEAWAKAPGLALLIDKVDRRIAGQPPAGLDEDAARFVAELAPEDLQMIRQLRLAVVLNPAMQLALLADPEDRPALRFYARGIHMVPALLAGVDSDYLLPVAELPLPGSRAYRYSSNDSQGLKSAEDLYQQLEGKPPSLGDLAFGLLQLLCPGPAGATPGEDRSNTVQAARAFYEAHAADSPLQLATFYLREGDENQQATALETLAKTKDPGILALVESRLFSSNIWSQNNYSLLDYSQVAHLHAYVLSHPERAAVALPPFLEQVKAELPDRLARMDESRRGEEAKEAKQSLANLAKALDQARPPPPAPDGKDKAEETGDEEANSRLDMALVEKTRDLPLREAVGVFLDAIVAEPAASRRQNLLMTFWSLHQYQWSERAQGPGRARQNTYQQIRKLLESFDDDMFQRPDYAAPTAARAQEARAAAGSSPATNALPAATPAATSGNALLDAAKQWEILLADDRSPGPAASGFSREMNLLPTNSVGDTAAATLATLLLDFGNLPPNRQMEVFALGDRLTPYWRDVARAALAGTPPNAWPPLPKADAVPPDVLSNLVQQLAAAAPDEQRALVRKLEPASLLALAQAVAKDKNLGAALAPAANRVLRIGADTSAFAPRLEPFVGETLSTNLFHGLREVAASLATQSVAATVTFRREAWLAGATLSIATNDAARNRRGYVPFGGFSDGRQAWILVSCQSLRDQEFGIWPVALPAPAPAAAAPDAEADLRAQMARLGIEVAASEISPEMLAEMATAMSAESAGHAEETQGPLLKAVEACASGAQSPLVDLRIDFEINLPPSGEDDEGTPHALEIIE